MGCCSAIVHKLARVLESRVFICTAGGANFTVHTVTIDIKALYFESSWIKAGTQNID
jgi:hypothetical protein